MNRVIIKLSIIFTIVLTSLTPLFSQTKGMYVLCYHTFGDKKDPYTLAYSTLKANLESLKRAGYKFVSFEDVVSGNIEGTKNILVTIDDGNKSVYEAYFSIMKPLGIKPVLGIYPAIIGRVHYALTWEELRRLSVEGCYIASHGYHHMYLSEKYSKEEPESFKKEIYYSKKVLEEKLGRKIEAMVYPFGVYSNIAVAEMKNAGYKYGLCLTQKMAYLPFEDSFAIPRYMITKPNQKGLMAFFAKKAQENHNVSTLEDSKKENSPKAAKKNVDIVSLQNYPQKISKMVANDIIFMPDNKQSEKPKNKKHITKSRSNFKPYIHSAADLKRIKKESKKDVTPSKKVSDQELNRKTTRHTFFRELKEKLFDIEKELTAYIHSFIDLAATKTAFVRDRIVSFFS